MVKFVLITKKSSSKVSTIDFKVSRGHFRPQMTFLGTSGEKIGHMLTYHEKSKIIKIAILTKNSIFHKWFENARNDVIWQEMDTRGVLEPFCTRNRYLNPFRSYFKQIWKIGFFFSIFHLWVDHKQTRRNFYRPQNPEIMLEIG